MFLKEIGMGKETDIDWSKINVGDKLHEIPYENSPFPEGGIVKKKEWGTSLYEGAIGDFWVQYPKGVYRFTIINRKIHSVSMVDEDPL